MTLPQAQKLCGMLMEDGYHCWIVEGYRINLLLNNQLYTLNTNEEPTGRQHPKKNG